MCGLKCRRQSRLHIHIGRAKSAEDTRFASASGLTSKTDSAQIHDVKNAYPVYIYNAKELVDRFNETEKIGVVPKGVTPCYCSLWFPKENIISFMNLPYEKTDEVAAHCVWQPLEEVKLLEE